ncbi:hypothetical protein U1Q18_027016 [Sarracenia purpurea var. burkii]
MVKEVVPRRSPREDPLRCCVSGSCSSDALVLLVLADVLDSAGGFPPVALFWVPSFSGLVVFYPALDVLVSFRFSVPSFAFAGFCLSCRGSCFALVLDPFGLVFFVV